MAEQDLNFKIEIETSSQKPDKVVVEDLLKNKPAVNSNSDNIEISNNRNNNENQSLKNNKKTNTLINLYKNASHPKICIFTILFKFLAFFCFIILAFFTSKKSAIYLIVIFLGSFDFWVVKNLSGRYLVGLRWWNEVKKNGEEVWIFESKNEKVDGTDRQIFWGSLYINAVGWGVLFIYELVTLSIGWCLVALVMFVFGGINLFGYFKCSKEQQGKLKTFSKGIIKSAGKKAMNEAIRNIKVGNV